MKALLATCSLGILAIAPPVQEDVPDVILVPVSDLVEAGFDRSRVVMMNEGHDGLRRCKRTRWMGRLVLPRAHAAGVRHLAAEALTGEFAQEANRTRKLPAAESGYLAQQDMRELLQSALDLGWSLAAYEAPFGAEPEFESRIDEVNWREGEQARNLARLLESLGDEARLLVWCGNSHLEKVGGEIPGVGRMRPMGEQFAEVSGIEPFSIDQIVSVRFSGREGWTGPWLEKYGPQLEASPTGTLGYLVAPGPSSGVDARVLSLHNELE